MSILAQNMKIIQRDLKCTQSAMSEILKVGFRTYVRYEAKAAIPGNASGEHFLVVLTDDDDAVVETNEKNNIASEPYVSPPIKPDLRVRDFTAASVIDSRGALRLSDFWRSPVKEVFPLVE